MIHYTDERGCTMKKQLVYIIATLVLLLSACADDGEKETTFKEKEDTATTENEAEDEGNLKMLRRTMNPKKLRKKK